MIVNKWEWIMDHKKEFLGGKATLANNYMSIQTNKQTHRQTHRKIDTHTDTHRKTDTRTVRHQTHRHADTHTERLTHRHPDRQKD